METEHHGFGYGYQSGVAELETEHLHRSNPWIHTTIHTAVAQDLKRTPELMPRGSYIYIPSNSGPNHKLALYIAYTPSMTSAVIIIKAIKRSTMAPISAFMTVPGLSLSCPSHLPDPVRSSSPFRRSPLQAHLQGLASAFD